MTDRPELEPIFAEAIAAAEQDEAQVLRDIADLAEEQPTWPDHDNEKEE